MDKNLDMEKLSMSMIEDQKEKPIPLNIMTIMAKVKGLFVMLNLLLALGGLNN